MFKRVIISLLIWVSLSNIAYANNLYEYTLLSNQPGLGIYKKANTYGLGLGEIYVQRINMKHVDVLLVNSNKSGDYFTKGLLTSYWNILSGSINALSVSNGAFFEDLTQPTTKLSFPLKVNGSILTSGVSSDAPNNRKMLVFKDQCASGYKCAFVMNYSNSNFNSSSYNNILVGLDVYVDKSSNFTLGRTFVGVDHSDSSNPIMYIVHATKAFQSDMRNIMYDLNIYDDAMIMLDGSGSSQLAFGNTKVYGSAGLNIDKRQIPQVLVVRKK